MRKSVVVTGSQGFIGTFLCQELLNKGYNVIGIDNFSKYGKVSRPHDNHPNFHLMEFDLSENAAAQDLTDILYDEGAEYLIAGAAMIGGISYFHKYAYDLLATNERIMANTFDAAIKAHQSPAPFFKRLVVISSSMVYEGADKARDNSIVEFNMLSTKPGHNTTAHVVDTKRIEGWYWPTNEGVLHTLPPPNSTYGFQKLAAEYFCKGANEQYGLPYTIVRPFNCVGVGEEDALGEEEVMSGNVKLMMSHVLPDLINKCLQGQDPLHILGDGEQVRCYTNGRDIARGIVAAMESDAGLNEDFNISTSVATTVRELAELVWKEVCPEKSFSLAHDEPYLYDVQKRIPDVSKAKELLGFEAQIPLDQSIQEVVEHMRNGNIQRAS